MKIRRFYWIGLIFLLTIHTSCIENNLNSATKGNNNFFNPFSEGSLDNNKQFKIYARFSECGEWGGHEEELNIYGNMKTNFYAKHIVYSFDCDSAHKMGFSTRLGIKSDKTIRLDSDKQSSVIKYLQKFVNAKKEEQMIASHAAKYFSATLSDSSYNIEIREDGESTSKNYNILISTLF